MEVRRINGRSKWNNEKSWINWLFVSCSCSCCPVVWSPLSAPPQQHLAVRMNVVEVAMRRVAVGPSWHCIRRALKGNLITLRKVSEASYMPSGTPRGAGRRVNCQQNYDWRSIWTAWSVWPALGTFELKAFCLLQLCIRSLHNRR
jgi:hypothetical protein